MKLNNISVSMIFRCQSPHIWLYCEFPLIVRKSNLTISLKYIHSQLVMIFIYLGDPQQLAHLWNSPYSHQKAFGIILSGYLTFLFRRNGSSFKLIDFLVPTLLSGINHKFLNSFELMALGRPFLVPNQVSLIHGRLLGSNDKIFSTFYFTY